MKSSGRQEVDELNPVVGGGWGGESRPTVMKGLFLAELGDFMICRTAWVDLSCRFRRAPAGWDAQSRRPALRRCFRVPRVH